MRTFAKSLKVKYIPKTIGADRAVSKWLSRARVAGDDYAKGVASPKKPWAAATAAAADTYQAAVSSPTTKSLFLRGVRRAGDARWAEMAAKKGVARFAQGVELSEQYYRSQIGDVIAQIEGVSLKPRGPRGSAQNYARGKDIGDKLHAWRLAKSATS